MIQITLKNFRKFLNNEFIFDKNLSLISGNSGKGKTSIFMAFVFALSGEGKKIVSHGKKTCSVRMKINLSGDDEIEIVRTKGPNRLLVTQNKNIFEDKIAQNIINGLFPNYDIGYMSQRVDDKVFILMSPMDKMKFIQKMTFGEQDVELLHTRCKNLIKSRKDSLMIVTSQRETTEKTLTNLNIEKIEHVSPKKFDHSSRELERQARFLSEQRTVSQNALAMRDDVLSSIDELELLNSNCSTMTISQLEEKINKQQREEILWAQYQKEKTILEKLSPSSGLSRSEIKSMIDDMRTLIDMENEIKHLENKRKDLESVKNKISGLFISLVCPKCDSLLSLNFEHKELKLAQNLTQSTTSLSEESIRNSKFLEKQKCKLEIEISELENKSRAFHELKNQYPNLDNAKNQLAELLNIKTTDDLFEKQKQLCEKIKTKKPQAENTIEKLKHSQKCQIMLSEKRRQLEKLTSSIITKDIDGEIEDISELLKEIQLYEKKVDAKKQWSQVEDLKLKENILLTGYPRSVKLHAIIKRAERMAIEEMISQINVHAQLYIDNFLENVSVTLLFDKSGGKNVENNKLTVDVVHDGHQSDLSSLSGGELARVVLAYTIALAEINNVKLLLLDECVASLDQETTTTVIDTIRKNFNGVVICIAHQTTTGIFDHVLELK